MAVSFASGIEMLCATPGGVGQLQDLVIVLGVRGAFLHARGTVEAAPLARWPSKRFDAVAELRLGKMLDKAKNRGTLRPYLRNANVQWFRIDTRDVKEIRVEDRGLAHCSVRVGDVVVCEGGEPGRAAVCGLEVDGMVIQKALHRVRPNQDMNPWFIAYSLRAAAVSGDLQRHFTGATIKHLTGKSLAAMHIAVPDRSLQDQVVEKIDELWSQLGDLESALRDQDKIRGEALAASLGALVEAGSPDLRRLAHIRLSRALESLIRDHDHTAILRQSVLDLATRGGIAPSGSGRAEPGDALTRLLDDGRRRLAADGSLPPTRYPTRVPVTDPPHAIPSHWKWLRLGDVGLIVGGGTPPSGDPEMFSDHGYAWLTPADMRGRPDRWVRRGARDVSEEGLRSSSATLLPTGTVVFSSRAPIGHVGIAANPLATNQGFKSCVPFVPELAEWIYLYLRQAGPAIDATASGTTFKEISGRQMALVPIPIPPLEEQFRVVDATRTVLAAIALVSERLAALENARGRFARAVVVSAASS
jgi:type I restriction enzyme S subunit